MSYSVFVEVQEISVGLCWESHVLFSLLSTELVSPHHPILASEYILE